MDAGRVGGGRGTPDRRQRHRGLLMENMSRLLMQTDPVTPFSFLASLYRLLPSFT